MEKIQFDSGIRSYRVNGGGILRFNPCDPNVYSRFLEAVDKLQSVEEELGAQAEQADAQARGQLMTHADGKMKEILSWVFGGENDFQEILGGVNLLAMADNGQRVVSNLFAALEPVLVEGARRCAGEQAEQARQKAAARRSGQA